MPKKGPFNSKCKLPPLETNLKPTKKLLKRPRWSLNRSKKPKCSLNRNIKPNSLRKWPSKRRFWLKRESRLGLKQSKRRCRKPSMPRKLDKKDWWPKRRLDNKQSSWLKLRESTTCRSSYLHRSPRGREKFKKNKREKKEFKEKFKKLKKEKSLLRLKRRGSLKKEGSRSRKQKPPPKLEPSMKLNSLLRKSLLRKPESLLSWKQRLMKNLKLTLWRSEKQLSTWDQKMVKKMNKKQK